MTHDPSHSNATTPECLSHSLFLAEHPVFERIARVYRQQLDQVCDGQSITIVCERKEDLIAVRAQIHQTLLQHKLVETDQVIDGITMLTLDNLTAKLIAALSNSLPGILSSEQIKAFQQPFLTVVQQEQLVKLILIQFGYFDADALPIAKQILALVDVSWPQDESFFQLLCDTQNKSYVKTVFDITEHSLKKILATYQATSHILAHFNRLQPFVTHYLETDFLDHAQRAQTTAPEHYVFPWHMLNTSLFWFSAPEYQTETTLYKPGNYQATLVDSFSSAMKQAQHLLGHRDRFVHARTILETTATTEPQTIRCEVSLNPQQYYEKTETTFETYKHDDSCFFLLGDFNPGEFRTIHPDAAGAYRVQKKWLDLFFAQRQQPQVVEDASNVSAVLNSLSSLYDEYQQSKDRLFDFAGFLQKLSTDYQLPHVDFSRYDAEIFYQSIQSDSVLLGESSALVKADRALSYFAHTRVPSHVVIFGRVHGQTSPSFNVKILNDAIFLLKRRGVVIELIASDLMYRGFWSWLLAQEAMSFTFLLPNQQSLDEMPETLRKQKLKNVSYDSYETSTHVLNTHLAKTAKQFSRPNWMADFSWRRLNAATPIVSASQFEDYIECPFRFYLNHLLKLDTDVQDSFGPLPLAAGIDAHAIAEKVISRFQAIASLSSQTSEQKDLKRVLERMQQCLGHESLYRTSSAESYTTLLNTLFFSATLSLGDATVTQLKALFSEIAAITYEPHPNESPLQYTLRTELLKRILRRLVDIELFLSQQTPQTIPVLCEFSQTLRLGPLAIACRLDRVDRDEQNRFHILDYKTSKIVASQKLTLLPSQRGSDKKLSVQGALYVMAFLSYLDTSDNQNPTIASFAEIRLRSLNDAAESSFLRFDFPTPLLPHADESEALSREYLPFSQALHRGDFGARPLDKNVCLYCEYRKICPTGVETIS